MRVGDSEIPRSAGYSSQPVDRSEALRIIPRLRADHVARDELLTPARTLYLDIYPDLNGTPVPEHMSRVGWSRLFKEACHFRGSTIELAEPLWVRYLPGMILVGLISRMSRLFGRSRQRTVAYAIENNSVGAVVTGVDQPSFWRRRIAVLSIDFAIRIAYDALAFGSQQAAVNYARCRSTEKIATAIFEPLPARSAHAADVKPEPRSAIFVGRLEERKGIQLLLSAWAQVLVLEPDAHLTIVGDGPLADEVAAFSSDATRRCSYLGAIDHSDVPVVIRKHQVFVAPSIPWGRWREQVGLPITEALREGLTVVATDQTGLAPWLEGHGHSVLTTPTTAQAVAESTATAMRFPLTRSEVRSALPVRSGRVAADHWLHRESFGALMEGEQ